MIRSNRLPIWSAALVAASLTAACSGSGGVQEESPTTSTPTPSATASVPEEAAEALTAYESFISTLSAAMADPTPEGAEAPAGADVTTWTWDPLRTSMRAYIADLADSGTHYAGTPHDLNPRVESVDLDAEDWPTVVISDCATGDDWNPVDADGNPVPDTAATTSPPPPYRITVTMIFHKKRWGASEMASDTSETCTP